MPSLPHIHTYRRYTNKYYMCGDPYCTHTIDKKMLEGKASRCNKCGNELKLTFEDLKRARPLCLDCSNTIQARRHRVAKSLVESIMPKPEEDIEGL